ncbi:hypothetical protein ASE98_09595 [Pseudomonas sp. Leaf48]|nr:hypothetical protein ASE98_09595 [Pseudomonas sp. Leaf48]
MPGKKTVMRDSQGCDTCATRCHSEKVAGHFMKPDQQVIESPNQPVPAVADFHHVELEQAVLTRSGEWPEPLSYRACGKVEGNGSCVDTV